MSTLRKTFEEKLKEQLREEFHLRNLLAVPRLTKIVVNMGVGVAKDDPKLLAAYREDLRAITGQQPAVRRAKKAEAGFKIKEGDEIGLLATLRGEKMWSFFEKLVRVVLPRIRDFRGLSRTGFDGQGNYNLGISEQVVFPEINPNKRDRLKSLGINLCTNAGGDHAAEVLLRRLGLPLVKEVHG
jgi:large subunit ribosomal protein L5